MKRTFKLKATVVLRMLAESLVLLGFLCLPALVFFFPQFQQLSLALKLAVCVLSVAALLLLPLYGFVNTVLIADDDGIFARSLFAKRFVAWDRMQKLELKRSWKSKVYAITYDGGEIAFPAWMQDQDELVALIRNHLPSGGNKSGGEQLYQQDNFSLLLQFARLILGYGFIVLLWCFLFGGNLSKQVQAGDQLLLGVICTAASILMIWRTLVVIRMPRTVQLTASELILRNFFQEIRLPWSQVKALSNSNALLPEGLYLSSEKGSFLLSDDLSNSDELKSSLQQRLVQ